MGSSGVAVDANGKIIKRQSGGNNNNGGNKKTFPNKNRGGGGQNGGGNGKGGNNNNKGNRNGNNNNNRGGPPRGVPMPIPPFMGGPMMPMMPMMPMQGPPNQFFNGRKPKNGNRNANQSSEYNGPSAANVGRVNVGGNMNQQNSGNQGQGPDAVDVPGFGKNSNIHELFGKMVWRKMEQIRDATAVDNLQNRIMNLIHEAIANQNGAGNNGQMQQGGGNFNNGGNGGGGAFNNGGNFGFNRF